MNDATIACCSRIITLVADAAAAAASHPLMMMFVCLFSPFQSFVSCISKRNEYLFEYIWLLYSNTGENNWFVVLASVCVCVLFCMHVYTFKYIVHDKH